MKHARVALACLLVLAPMARAQEDSLSRPAIVPAGAPRRLPVPFGQGERADYGVKYGPFSVGRGSTEIAIDTLRGRETWHVQFRIRGGIPGFRVNDLMESWIETSTLASLRFHQELHEGGRQRSTQFEIFPDSIFVQNNGEPQKTVLAPLDEGAFLFFVRTIPLEVGAEYAFDRYFRPDRNPVRIQVLRRERIEVPAGKFETIVIRPIIKSRGLFSEGGKAEVWLTDDSRRIMVQMKTQTAIGGLSLFLRSYTPAKTPPPDSTVAK